MPPPSARAMPTKSPSSLRHGVTLTHPPHTPNAPYQVPSSRSQNGNMTGDITRAAMEDFRKLFEMFDKNGDDTIDKQEFEEIVTMLNGTRPSRDQLERMIRVACEEDNQASVPQSLNFSQFMRFFAIYKQDWPEDVSEKDIFKVLDEDGGGTISAKELWKVLNRFGMRITEDEANAMADFATPLPGANEIRSVDMRVVAQEVKRLRARNQAMSTDSSDE